MPSMQQDARPAPRLIRFENALQVLSKRRWDPLLASRKGGFLTYEHNGDNPDVVVSLAALHHLPDFWKAVALKRIYDLLKPEGHFLLGDSAYSFPLSEYQSAYNVNMSKWKAQVSKRLFEQMRRDSSSEFMTFTWILEGILDRVGFTIEKADYPTDWFAQYICRK
jgi:putative AdoMet-dependent methyltransferase